MFAEVGREFRQSVYQIQQGEVSEAIYDATNAVRKQRRQAIALARISGFTHITGLWLNTPLYLCLKRNQERDRQVPDAVIERMYRRLYAAPPSEPEGLDWVIELCPHSLLPTPHSPQFANVELGLDGMQTEVRVDGSNRL